MEVFFAGDQLQIGDRDRAIEVADGRIGGEEWRPQSRDVVGARLHVELPPARGFLNAAADRC